MGQRAGVQQLQRRAGTHQRVLVDRVGLEGPVAPVAERRAQPLAPAHEAPRLLDEEAGVGPEGGQPLLLLVEEVLEGDLHPCPEVGAVPAAHAPRLGHRVGGAG